MWERLAVWMTGWNDYTKFQCNSWVNQSLPGLCSVSLNEAVIASNFSHRRSTYHGDRTWMIIHLQRLQSSWVWMHNFWLFEDSRLSVKEDLTLWKMHLMSFHICNLICFSPMVQNQKQPATMNIDVSSKSWNKKGAWNYSSVSCLILLACNGLRYISRWKVVPGG